MTPITQWLDRVFLINLEKRQDRFIESMAELQKIGYRGTFERFEAYGDLIDHNGKINGNFGCTSSHRAVLEIIAVNRLNRVLVLEDDFMLRPKLAADFPALFDSITQELPADWRMLYLGGSYGENPKRRFSPHLIETNAVMTTSSYVINWRQARRMAPHISGIGPIDSLYHKFNREPGCFMAYPRLFVQRPSFSDLTERMSENVTSMEDEAHEDMLLTGAWKGPVPKSPGERGQFVSTINRREVTWPKDLLGTQVIVGSQLFTIVEAVTAPHFPHRPWFRGEPCTYSLILS